MTTPTPALLPCPFCGGPAEFEEVARDSGREAAWSVGCRMKDGESECIGQQSLLTFSRKIEAIAAWNTRHPSPALPTPALAGLADELRRLLDGVTPRPWRKHKADGYIAGSASDYAQLHVPRDNDRDLILALVNNLDTLLAALAAPPATLEAQVRGLVAEWGAEAGDWMAGLSPPGLPERSGDLILRERIKRLNECADALAALLTGGENG